jgi:hypothetical protein
MKRILMLTFIAAFAASTFAFGQLAGKKGESAEQQVKDLTAQYFDATRTRNMAFLEKLIAPEFSEVSSAGHVLNRGQWLESMKSPPSPAIGQPHFDVIDVKVYGNVAILSERHNITTHDDKGVASIGHAQAVRIFVKRHGKWQVVAAQATPLKD